MTDAHIFSVGAPRIFSIASGRPFLPALARETARAFKALGLPLSAGVIYLPTRRAARALSLAFLETADGDATLLPRIAALGDVDEDEIALFAGEAEDELDLAPAISGAERRLILARFVAERDRAQFNGQRRWAGAVAAADELGKLLDSLYTEEIPFSRLETLAPAQLARHWEASLEFLQIITRHWPSHLAAAGLLDPADRRIRLINAQTERWTREPPKHPVIIAGTTGSAPAVARLMKVVATMPLGAVALPGLDLEARDTVWRAVDEPHPQSGLAALLETLQATRETVREWPGASAPGARRALISMALLPADASGDWKGWADRVRENPAQLGAAIDGLTLLEMRDEESEAAAIAIRLRETVEHSDKTAILVTPDRDLARRVAAQMRRWKIHVDDSGGAPFGASACGGFMRLVAHWLAAPGDVSALLSLMRHPLFAGGLDIATLSRAVAQIDVALRGLAPEPEMAAVIRMATADPALQDAGAALLNQMQVAHAYWSGQTDFDGRLRAHIAIAEDLARSNDGELPLWAGDDGAQGAAILAQLQDGAGLIVQDLAEDYAEIFDRLIAAAVVRRRTPSHPRIAILGPLEARLQNADVVILGGLNEGVWPRDAAIDPFLSRGMRRDLGLPSPERRIGLAAHDFMQLSAAGEVMLTRAQRSAGKPTKPSRWIVRLRNILKGAGKAGSIDQSARYGALVAALDAPEKLLRAGRPEPRPPQDARPRDLYVTQFETLMRDPYAVYARHVLGLKKLNDHGEAFDMRHLGSLLHEIFAAYALDPAPSVDAGVDALWALLDARAEAAGMTPVRRALWRQRLQDAFVWFAQWDAERRQTLTPAIIEQTGEWRFACDGLEYSLSARADRIDAAPDGEAFIIDFKTGTLPTLEQINTGFSPQLPLTGVIAMEGGFGPLGRARLGAIEYLKVINRDSGAKPKAEGDAAREIAAEAREGMLSILRHFADPGAPYLSQPRPQYANKYGDYDHLARRRERNAQGGDE